MCGIIGHVDTTGRHPVDRAAFHRLTASLSHRGPDAQGQLYDERVSLGHCRLSILDLSAAANQPLSDPERTVSVTYNGEIYNYRELRQTLVRLGHRFLSASDTEVLVNAYKEWGIDCVRRFNGMFAFGLYDRRSRELYLVRDRLGIKPLYYGWSDGRFLFSSEIKGIINYPGFRRRLNPRAMSSFLSFRYALGHETYFENVSQLVPGTYLLLRDGESRLVTYWDVDLDREPLWLGPVRKAALRGLIADAVEKRTVSDVPLSALLSGGLDSTIILYELSRTCSDPVKAFTAVFPGVREDETHYARLASQHCGAQLHVVTMDAESYREHLPELIRYKDQPLGMHNEVAMYLLAKAVKKHATVMLCGEGADELFSGYGRIFRSPFDAWRLRILAAAPPALRDNAVQRLGLDPRLLGLDRVEHFLFKYSYFPFAEKSEIYTDRMRRETARDEHAVALFAERFRRAAHRSFHDAIAYAFVKLHLPGLLLMIDAASMAASVEARTPFLDHRLVDAAFAVPARYKLRWKSGRHLWRALGRSAASSSEENDTTKLILRDLYRDALPREILERRKMPFPVPLSDWFKRELRPLARRELLSGGASTREIFDRDRLACWMDRMEAQGHPDYGRRVWLLLNLEMWLRAYA